MPPSAHARNFQNCIPFSWIEAVASDARLSPGARHMGHVLAMIADEGRAVATLARLSNLTGFHSGRTLIEARNELERAGHIRVERSGARRIDAIVLVGEGVV